MWWRRSATCSSRPKRPRRSNPAAGLRRFLGRLMRVQGTSMLPALRPGDVVFVQESAYQHRAPRRGDIVVARPPSLGGRALVKRVLGTPYEKVVCAAPFDFAQGSSRASGSKSRDSRTWSLGPDEYFLLGDHAEGSLDSRTLGPITRRELIGRVRLRVWPPHVLRESS